MKYKIYLLIMLLVLAIPFSFGATLNGTSSIYTFNVSNCVADDYVVGCDPQTIKYSCDVSNTAFADYVEFRIDGTLYNASKVGFNWYVNYFKVNQTSTINESLVLDRIYITDTNSDTAIFDDNVAVLHDCVTCTDVGTQDACSIYDNTTIYHVFEPVGCSVDFNESIFCDYCSQDLNQVLGECQINNTQSVSYYDANFFSCCDVTGWASDCFILDYPYNETTSQACSFLTQDFVCVIPALAELRSEMAFTCLLPSDDFTCVVNVYEDGRLLQVNPQAKDYATGLFTLKGERIEDKEYFSPNNNVVNAYFTDDNLLTDKAFMVETSCSDGSQVIKSQYMVEPFYNTLGGVNNRLVWAKDNAIYMMIAGLIVVLVALFIGYLVRSGKGKN